MTVRTRIDKGTITLELSISIEDEDRAKIGEYQTEEEYVKQAAREKVKETHGDIRGNPTVSISSTKEKDNSDTNMTVYYLIFHSRWES
jgi:hypothetical protein